MATTRIMPLHVGKGRTESRAISDIIDYVANPKKTDDGRLITGYACDSLYSLMLESHNDTAVMLAEHLAEIGRASCRERVCQYV